MFPNWWVDYDAYSWKVCLFVFFVFFPNFKCRTVGIGTPICIMQRATIQPPEKSRLHVDVLFVVDVNHLGLKHIFRYIFPADDDNMLWIADSSNHHRSISLNRRRGKKQTKVDKQKQTGH